MVLYDNFTVNSSGRLEIGGCDATVLAKTYGTPLYVVDENKFRENCRAFKAAVKKSFGDNSEVLFASKALSFLNIYRILNGEDMGADVVSCGEIATVKEAGFPLSRAYFHGNNKTDADILYAVQNGVGFFIVDNLEEIEALDRIAGENNVKQKALLRVTPGIDPHTHEKVATAKIDSKFGVAITTGQAEEAAKLILSKRNIDFFGFHCHIGSQILEEQPFIDAADIMLSFAIEIKSKLGFTARAINLGGGYGIAYKEGVVSLPLEVLFEKMSRVINEKCAENNFPVPKMIFEPGRRIAATAGATLYTVGTNKEITGYKRYISVDGSMSDSPRYALYGEDAVYTVVAAGKMNEPLTQTADIAGRCCESGDIIQTNVKLPALQRGDILAVLCTGAYNHSMSMNYNRLPRPAAVMVKDKSHRLIIERQSFDDVMKNEL